MALFAIGDLHLSLGTDKPMDVFGAGWDNYVERISEGFSDLTENDVCVLCGDLSWAMTLEESLEDFRFIDRLPGRKIILKGNHDYWWSTVTKIKSFFDANNITTIDILHNNCFFYDDIAICGTRGWFFEEESGEAEQNKKILNREMMRLERSLEAAGQASRKICFFHYPPRYNKYTCDEIIQKMNEHGVKECWYGHIHSYGHKFAVQGDIGGIMYNMVSADYVKFRPIKVI